MQRMLIRAGLALAALLGAVAARAGVLIVGPGPGEFAEIQSAVDAAQDGDVVLVKGGTYARVTIVNRGIEVAALVPGATVTIAGPLQVLQLAVGKTVVLDGLRATGITGPLEPDGYGLLAAFCAGRIRVQGCAFQGADGNPLAGCAPSPFDWGWDGSRVSNCSDVAFTSCDFVGGRGADEFAPGSCAGGPATGPAGGNGLRVNASNVAVFRSALAGGRGGDAWTIGGAGGHGARVNLGTLHLAGSGLNGADGGDAGGNAPNAVGGAGGSCVSVEAASLARLENCALSPASSGVSPAAPTPIHAPVFAGPGAVVLLGGPARTMDVPAILHEGEAGALVVHALPGEVAWLFVSPAASAIYAPVLAAPWLLGNPLVGPLPCGTVKPSGTVQLPIVGPLLPAGLLAASVQLQVVCVATAGAAGATGFRRLLLLDASL